MICGMHPHRMQRSVDQSEDVFCTVVEYPVCVISVAVLVATL